MRLEEIEDLSLENFVKRVRSLGGVEKLSAHILKLLLEKQGAQLSTSDVEDVIFKHGQLMKLVQYRLIKEQ